MKTENRQKTKKTRAMRHRKFFLALLLIIGVGAASAQENDKYVLLYKDNATYFFMQHNDDHTTDRVSSPNFDKNKCVFTKLSNPDGSVSFENNGYLMSWTNESTPATGNDFNPVEMHAPDAGDETVKWTTTYSAGRLRGFTKIGETFRWIQYTKRSSGPNGETKYWQAYSTTTSNPTAGTLCVLAAYSEYERAISGVSVSGPATISTVSSSTEYIYTGAVNATPSYKRFDGYTNTSTSVVYYMPEGGSMSTTAPAAEPIPDLSGYEFEWYLTSNMDGYATVTPQGTTCKIKYINSVPESSRTAVLTCAAKNLSTGEFMYSYQNITFASNLYLVAPTITSTTNENILVTLSHPESDVVLWYALNAEALTEANRIRYTGPFQVEEGTLVIAAAHKDGYHDSPTASALIHYETGVYGSKVILHEHEDHNWTYYSGVDPSLDGGNYNTNYAGHLYSPDPRNVKIIYNGGGVANASPVAISGAEGEGQNQMIYCITIEKDPFEDWLRGDGTDYPYQVISNPFSKRPRKNNHTGDTDGYYGFGGWKIISGGEHILEYNNGQIIPLDAIIHFTDMDNGYKPNVLSATVELEATWVPANVFIGSTTPTFTDGTYETNFWVINADIENRTYSNLNMTVTAMSPDGGASLDNYDTYKMQGLTIDKSSTATTKFEWMKFYDEFNIDGGGRNLYLGRGLDRTDTKNCTVYGSNQESGIVDQVLKIESGTYYRFYHYGANPSQIVKQIAVLGCDYDRASGKNDKLKVKNYCRVGDGRVLAYAPGNRMSAYAYVKSGTLVDKSVGTAPADNCYYMSVANSGKYFGCRYLEVQGGVIANIAGGFDQQTNVPDDVFTLRMKGGEVKGSVYGAATFSGAKGNRTLVFTGGTVKGWIAGGANGTQETNGLLDGAAYVYVGGNAQVNSSGSGTVINRSVGGNVFGAGCGFSKESTSGQVTLGTNVVVADNAYVERGVYGGGSYGYCDITKTANIYITGNAVVGGENGGVNGTSYDANIQGGIYGGACQNKGGNVNLYMLGGTVNKGGIFGGSNQSGTLLGDVKMMLYGGQTSYYFGPSGVVTVPVFGGGYGAETMVDGNIDIYVGKDRNDPVHTTWILGALYGGGALGNVNIDDTKHTYIHGNYVNMAGEIYGGCLGDAEHPAVVNGPVTIDYHNGTSHFIFGGNNAFGAPQSTININMDGGQTYDVFGGGNAAAYTGTPVINITGGKVLESVYGGGFGATSTITGNTSVTISGENTQIGQNVYGGGASGSITGNTEVSITDAEVKGSVFGAGYGAMTNVGGDAQVNLAGKATVRTNVYGGGEAGDVTGQTFVVVGDTEENDKSVSVKNVFGAGKGAESNVSGVVDTNGALSNEVPDELGSNGTHVTIQKSTTVVRGDVFGGAEEGTVRADAEDGFTHNNTNATLVNFLDGRMQGNLYGGGKLGLVKGRTVVNMRGGTVEGNIFGGAMGVQGTTLVQGLKTVNMTGGLVLGDVYGGSQNANDTNEYFEGEGGEKDEPAETEADKHSSVFINISGGQVGENVYGGGFYGTIEGNVTVNIGVDAINNATDHDANINKLTLGTADKLMTRVEGSVYAGSDWGEITEGGVFGPQNISGYSNIYIDGNGYDMQAELKNNYMNIDGSLYGAGTSSDAGKKARRIFIRNYGLDHAELVADPVTGEPKLTYSTCTRKLFTIQRADSVFLENAHITFRGQGNMASPSTTQHYSMYNIFRVLRLVNNSTIDCDFPIANLFSWNSMSLLDNSKTIFNAKEDDYYVVMYDRYKSADDEWSDYYEDTEHFKYDERSQLADYVCEDDAAVRPRIDNKVRMNNGIYISVRYPRTWNTELTANQYEYGDEINAEYLYGEWRGFFHIIYPEKCGFIYSRPRVTTNEQPGDLIYNNNQNFTGCWEKENIYDGGTSSYRYAKAFDAHGGNVTLLPVPDEDKMLQGPYINHLPNTTSGDPTGPAPTEAGVVCDRNYYRVWEIKGAGGDSQVEAVLVAKSDGLAEKHYLTSTVSIPLSPINQGGYVKVRQKSADASWGSWGDDVVMVDAGMISQGTEGNNWAYFNESGAGTWSAPVSIENTGVQAELAKIDAAPNITFGLSLKPLQRLTETQVSNEQGTEWTATQDMIISSGTANNDYFFRTHRLLGGGDGAAMIELCLTYSNQIDRNTVLSPMTVIFDEYDANGNLIYTTEVNITITTQTAISQDFDEPLYALMYGKGEPHDMFSVKATLPIFALEGGFTESTFKVKSIGEFQPAEGQENVHLVSVNNFLNNSNPGENTVAVKFGPSLTFDNSLGWLSGFEYSDPEASLYDVTDASLIGKTLGTADGRKNFGLQFDLYYNGSIKIETEGDKEIGRFDVTLEFDHVASSSSEDNELAITVVVYKRGKGRDWYIDGVNGLNSNHGHNPDAAKYSLNGVLADEYKPGDNIFIVNQVTINSTVSTVWPDEKGGSEGVTIYRYPGGHLLKDGTTDPNGCYDGPLVVAKSDFELYGITLNSLDTIVNNGKEYYTINNVSYEKGENFDFTVNSPIAVVEDGGTMTLSRSEFIYNNNKGTTDKGGAICVKDGGTLNLGDLTRIANNKTSSSEGAGIYVCGNGIVNLMELVTVTDNFKGTKRNNVYLPTETCVLFIDKTVGLYDGSVIGITKNEFPQDPTDPLTEWDFTPVAYSAATHISEEAFDNGAFYDDQSIYVVYYDPKNHDYLENTNIYFGKTWVSMVTDKPTGWSLDAIDTPADLAWFISYVNGYNDSEAHPNAQAMLAANIDMDEYIWVPIGDGSNAFSGTFDGQGYEITGLHSNITGLSGLGLFGTVDGGTVKNTFVYGGDLKAVDRAYMGSIAGIVRNGKVFGCEGAANLSTDNQTTIMGGLVGLLDNATLHSCISTAKLNGYQMGGLVGETTDGSKVLNSYSFTEMTDAQVEDEDGEIIPNTHLVAGFVADNASTGTGSGTTISNCYLRLRDGNSISNTTLYAFDAASRYVNKITDGYYYREDNYHGYLSNGSIDGDLPDGDGSWRTFWSARHPYSYGNKYNRLNYMNNPTAVGPYMLDKMNENAEALSTVDDIMLPWTRTTSDINDDFPILKMGYDKTSKTSFLVAASTNCSDDIIYYHRSIDEAFTRYAVKSAIVAVYANAPVDRLAANTITANQSTDVKFYINEDVAVLQTSGSPVNAYVGITLDNSAGANGANPTVGGKDVIDWHMFSTSLANAPLGINYNGDNEQHDWWHQGIASYYSFYPDNSENAGYFPGDTPNDPDATEGYDFYCFYEPMYHWINFKRNGNSHWHEDGANGWIDYGYTGNDGNYHLGSVDNNESKLIVGKGYLAAVVSETYLQAHGTLNNGDVSYQDVTFSADAVYPGLNLIGNPYQSFLDFKAFAEENSGSGKIWNDVTDASYTIMDEDMKGYIDYHYDASWNDYIADRFINMHQGFFVRTQDNATATFTNEMRSAVCYGTSFRGDDQPRYPLVNLILSEENGNKDYAVVELDRTYAGGAKKNKSLKVGEGQIYVHNGEEDYSIAFFKPGTTSAPVRFRTSSNAVFTLNWNTQNGEFSYLHLIDNLTGVDVDCLTNDEYVFGASPDDYESRFKLVFQYTGVEENQLEISDNFAFFSGEDLIVNGQGRLECIDMQGRVIYVTDLYGTQNHVSLPGFAQGLYLLHLTSGKQSMIQKIVIR